MTTQGQPIFQIELVEHAMEAARPFEKYAGGYNFFGIIKYVPTGSMLGKDSLDLLENMELSTRSFRESIEDLYDKGFGRISAEQKASAEVALEELASHLRNIIRGIKSAS